MLPDVIIFEGCRKLIGLSNPISENIYIEEERKMIFFLNVNMCHIQPVSTI